MVFTIVFHAEDNLRATENNQTLYTYTALLLLTACKSAWSIFIRRAAYSNWLIRVKELGVCIIM